MADIAELGLGVGTFNSAVDSAVDRLKDLATEAALTTGNFVAMAAVIGGTVVSAIVSAKKEMEGLEQTLRDIKSNNPFNDQLVSVQEMEKRVKSLRAEIEKIDSESYFNRVGRFIGSSHILGGKGFDESEEKRAALRESEANEIENNLQRIANREARQLEVLNAQLAGEKQVADELKIQLEYNEKIAKAIESQNGPLAAVLAKERDRNLELSRQSEKLDKFDRQGDKEWKKLQGDDAKQAEKDRAEADKLQEKWERNVRRDELKAIGENEKDDAKGREDDAEAVEEYTKADEQALERQKAEQQRRTDQLNELARRNRGHAQDAQNTAAVGAARQRGDGPFANELQTRADFNRRRRDAYERHASQDEIDAINQAEEQAMRDALAAESRQTPGQARNERREQHRHDIEANRQTAREAELRRRGERGEDSRAIREQREKDARRHNMQHQDEQAKRDANQQKGWTQQDAENLRKCAEGVQDKD